MSGLVRRSPVALVVDTGVDDALALLVAARHPALDLRAVVASAGNAGLDRVLANTAWVLSLLGCDVPLAAGPAARRDGSPLPPRAAHGPDGLAGLGPRVLEPAGFPRPEAVLPAGVTLACLGPLTAVAALATLPGALSADVVAACAGPGEANRAMDLTAADELERLGLPLRHDGGAAFAAPTVSAATAAAMAASTDPVTALVGGLLAHQARRRAGIGDAGTVLRLAEPGIGAEAAARRLVELAGG